MNPLTIPIRGDRYSMNWEVKELLFDQKSEFQQITIVDTTCFGKALLLDGHIQFTELDEHAYHESLVQIPLMSLPLASRALVVGGGDGGVVRELCRKPDMVKIDMVEIDPMVIEACRKHLPSLSAGSFDDPRVKLHVKDAFEFVKTVEDQTYDLLILDSTDTYEGEEGELSEMLFTENFYQDCSRILKDDGIVITQADNVLFCPYSLKEIQESFLQVFAKCGWYWGLVPSFGSFSAFCWASKGFEVSSHYEASRELKGLQYLNPHTYALAFSPLPFSLRFADAVH